MSAKPRPDRRPPIGKPPATYAGDVFINCPFDEEYRPIRDAVVFAVFACRLRPRCALEAYDGGNTRIDKIIALIRDCRWGIHDISRTESNAEGLPRFNMPLELGLFLGANRFGDVHQRDKSCLVLDREPFRFQKFISDIAGQDPIVHHDQPHHAIEAVRNWIASELRHQASRIAGGSEKELAAEIRKQAAWLPGGAAIAARFTKFQKDLPDLCARLHLQPEALTFTDYCDVISDWLTQQELLSAPG